MLPASCPECGVTLDQPWSDRTRLNHLPGSKSCKVRAWERETRERDLVRVEGELAVQLIELDVPVTYGLVHQDSKSIEMQISRGARKPFVTSAFVPRWAVLVLDAAGTATLPRTKALVAATFQKALSEPEFAQALSSVGIICGDDTRGRRSAIMELIRANASKFDKHGRVR